MKFIDEYRDPVAAREIARQLAVVTTRPWTLMEVCGGQTHAIVRFGVDELLPPGIRLLHGHRWAEPLRDALPRLLRDDLARFVPGLWTGPAGPAPPNVATAGRVQVELLALQGSLPRRQVTLAARWVVTPAGALTAPRADRADLTVPWTEVSPESLVVAQRVAMWRLAQRIAASLQGG